MVHFLYNKNKFGLIKYWNKIIDNTSPAEFYTVEAIKKYLKEDTEFEFYETEGFVTINEFAEILVLLDCNQAACDIYQFLIKYLKGSVKLSFDSKLALKHISIEQIACLIKTKKFEEAEDRLIKIYDEFKVEESENFYTNIQYFGLFADLYLKQNKIEQAIKMLNVVDSYITEQGENLKDFDETFLTVVRVKIDFFFLTEKYDIAEELTIYVLDKYEINEGKMSVNYLELLIKYAELLFKNNKIEDAIARIYEADKIAGKLLGVKNKYASAITKLKDEFQVTN